MDKKIIHIFRQSSIPIGYQGETKSRRVVFESLPISVGSGTWSLTHRRAKDTVGYPVELKTEGETLVWDITSADTAIAGAGNAQLVCVGDNGEVLMSSIYQTITLASVDGSGEVPEAAELLMAQMLKTEKQTEQAADEAKTAQQSAEQSAQAAEDAATRAEQAAEEADFSAEEALLALTESGLISPAGNGKGGVYTNNGKILVI